MPRILWLGAKSKELVQLQEKLQNSIKPMLSQERLKPYHPHITLARLKYGQIKQRWLDSRTADFIAITLIIKKITLYNSKLTRKGPVYHAYQHFRFNRDK
jgi:2'-5' RNA ligase